MALFQVVIGFIMLGFGGDALVRGAVAVAHKLGVSKLFIGLILVGFGTSVPELVTSLNAALAGSAGIALGNVVGSNIANILLILGLTAALATVSADRAAFRRDAPVLAVATLICVALALTAGFGRLVGLVLTLLLVVYVVTTYRSERRKSDPSADLHEREADLVDEKSTPFGKGVLFALGGLVLVMLGAVLIVSGSVSAARMFGVPEAVIGLTIVAIGTSLPELAASITAARQRQTDLAYGNIIGSNIFNILGILGITALVSPIHVPAAVIGADALILAGATALLFWFAWTQARVSRREGAVFLALYISYLGFQVWRSIGA